MILYHGTNIDFGEVRLDKSRVGKDFGFGFYLTPDKQVAARQAARKFRTRMASFDALILAILNLGNS